MSIFSLYSWGANSYGQLCLGTTEDALLPMLVEGAVAAEDIAFICGGGGHTLLLLKNGELMACGSNSRGQLGQSEPPTAARPLRVPLSEKVKKIAAGWETSFAITESGALWGWGSNTHGQLGVASSSASIPTPRLLSLPRPIIDVACGSRHTLAVTDDGRVFSWGLGRRGQLGTSSAQSGSPEPIPDLPPVQQCVAGDHHSAVLLRDASAASVWGDNRFGQCGPNAPSGPSCHQPVPLIFQRPVRRLVSAWTHLSAIAEDGLVLTWGRNSYQQLGRGCPIASDANPLPVAEFHVQDLVCGSQHTLAISSGLVLAWGWGEHGICGGGSEKNTPRPNAVQLPGEAVLVGCGAGTSFAVIRKDRKASMLTVSHEDHQIHQKYSD